MPSNDLAQSVERIHFHWLTSSSMANNKEGLPAVDQSQERMVCIPRYRSSSFEQNAPVRGARAFKLCVEASTVNDACAADFHQPAAGKGQDWTAHIPLKIKALAPRDGYSVDECWQLDAAPEYARSALNWIVAGDTTPRRGSRSSIRIARRARRGLLPCSESPFGHGSTGFMFPAQDIVGLKGHTRRACCRLTVILNGLIRMTAPRIAPGQGTGNNTVDTSVAHLVAGAISSSVLIAADQASTSTIAGHYTEFPSDE